MKYPKILIGIIIVAIVLYLFGVIKVNIDQQGNISAGLTNDTEQSNQTQPSDDSNPLSAQTQHENDDYIVYDENFYDGPTLMDADFSKMNFFTDGYEIATVVHCSDGDTVIFNMDGGREYKTRFLAVDTPEKHEDNREKEPWGKASSAFTYDKIMNARQIIIQSDPDSDIKDKYGRLLAWIWIDGKLLNYMLVDASLAQVKYLYGDYLYTDDLLDIEKIRRNEGKKIWGERDPDYDYN